MILFRAGVNIPSGNRTLRPGEVFPVNEDDVLLWQPYLDAGWIEPVDDDPAASSPDDAAAPVEAADDPGEDDEAVDDDADDVDA